ncbi:MAG: alcohol dehydrogenase [Candidatus Velthaea sp.]
MHAVAVPSAHDARLEYVERERPEPSTGTVRLRIAACGICHSDVLTVRNAWPGISFPRVPGHEIAGTIDALGAGVTGWREGDRVGVGWHGGHDGTCERCRRGDFLTCENMRVPGIAYDGGYAEYAIVPAVALARIPAELPFAEAAPLMCAGVTTFNALRHSVAGPGDLVAVLGIGGLGHLGVQFAAKMGFRTVAVARGKDKEELARRLGAAHYVDSAAVNPGAELERLGGAKVILSTITSGKAIEPVIAGLGFDAQLLVVGTADEPLALNTAAMIGKRQSVKSWPSGTCVDSEDAMNFSVLTGVHAMIETMPLAEAPQAFARMMSGAARFRMVLTMENGATPA